MHWIGRGRRALADLCLAMAIAFALVVLNVSINFIESIHRFFRDYSGFPLTDLLINALFFWLAVLLWVAFVRWRRAARRRAELEDVVSSISPDVLMVVTPERKVVMCNESVRRVFGYAPEEVIHKKTDLLYSDRRRNRGRRHEIYDALERDGFHVGLATGRKKSGELIPLEIITGELSGRTGAVLLLRDITERVRVEEERRELEARMRQQQKLESLGILAGGIAHDFNNMLTVLMANAELALLDTPKDSPARENLDGIVSAAKHAGGLCAQLLEFAGKGSVATGPVELSRLIRETERLLETTAGEAVRIEYALSEEVQPVEGDRVQLQQVLINLVTNAVDAMGEEGGIVSVATGAMECDEPFLAGCYRASECGPGAYVFLKVRDSGGGMDAETQAQIFDPFFTTKAKGRGLGLASVLGIVRAHGGAVRVESSPGEGSAISILLPLTQPPPEER